MSPTSKTNHEDCGGRLVALDGRILPLVGVEIHAEAGGGLARVALRQSFRNPHQDPLKVTYQVPLPADGAVAGYEIRIGGRKIRGEIDRREQAREKFERALMEGRSGGLLDQERTSLFTQEIGNVPPGADVAVELTIDQRLAWLPDGMWEWRFPTVVSPRYLGAEGRVADARRTTVDVAGSPTGARASFGLIIRDPLPGSGAPESPSHSIAFDGTTVAPAGERVPLDRDVVIRWPVARPRPGIALRRGRPMEGSPHGAYAYGVLTIVPPPACERTMPRDLVLLLDTSGSMAGRPLAHAVNVAAALIDTLSADDSLEMLSFSSTATRWRSRPVPATVEMRREARRWLEALRAGGGTEMTSAVEEALRPLAGDRQRQVVLVTDGEVGFESDVCRAVRDGLPAGSRLHTVGIGSCVNRTLTHAGARAGRGVEVLVDLDEDPGRGAGRLVAATRGPVIVDLEIRGPAAAGTAPRGLPDLMAGSPALVGVRLKPGGGPLIVSGRTTGGVFEETIEAPATASGEGEAAAVAFYGREAVEDLELDLAAGANREEADRAIERVGLEFGIATRLTSWVAVGEEPSVDPGAPVRVVRIPQELPYGLSAEGLGLRGTASTAAMTCSTMMSDVSLPSFLEAVIRPRDSARASARLGIPRIWEGGSAGFDRDLAGRLVPAGRDDVLVIEFEVTDKRLRWHPSREAFLILRDGTEEVALADPALMTRPGIIEPGCLVRLALAIDRGKAAEVEVAILASGGVLIRIHL